MARRRCRPSTKVRRAGRQLSTSTSPSVRSAAGRILAKHRHTNH